MRTLWFILMVLLMATCATANMIAYYGDGIQQDGAALSDLVGYSGMTANDAAFIGWENANITRSSFGVSYTVGPTGSGTEWFFQRTSHTTGSTGTPAAPVDSTDYVGITLTADAGNVINLDTITFGLSSAAYNSSVQDTAWQTDYIVFVGVDGAPLTAVGLDTTGAAGDLVSGSLPGAYIGPDWGPVSQETVDLSAITGATSVEIRIALANNKFSDLITSATQGFQVHGDVVPEPATLALLGLGLALIRRRK